MPVLRFLLFVVAGLPSMVQAQWRPLPEAESHVVDSRILGEPRDISVVTPPGYAADSVRLTVVVLLDGDGLLPPTAGLQRFLPSGVPLLLVGVRSVSPPDRVRNFTPAPDSAVKARHPQAGGAGTFQRFLEDEVLPLVAKHYRTNGAYVLVGHSLAGLFAVQVFLDPRSKFAHVVAISPTLGWQGQAVVRQAIGTAPQLRARRIFLSTADEGDRYPPGPTARLDSLLTSAGVPSTRRHYPGYDHMTTVPPALYDGLRLLLQ
jgi:predicted alpha/beta superfamily hydrolase